METRITIKLYLGCKLGSTINSDNIIQLGQWVYMGVIQNSEVDVICTRSLNFILQSTPMVVGVITSVISQLGQVKFGQVRFGQV